MSVNMYLYSVPEDHIHFIKNNKIDFFTYKHGIKPKLKAGFFSNLFGLSNDIELPSKWPETDIQEFNPEITSDQIDLYHYVLNGAEEFVSHEGCLFQTWYLDEDKGSAIKLDGDTYAFQNKVLPNLINILNILNKEIIIERTEEFLKENLHEEELAMLLEGFNVVNEAALHSLKSNNGLVWYGW